MSDRLSQARGWHRARAVKLHEHFRAVDVAVGLGGELGEELARVAELLDGRDFPLPGGGAYCMRASYGTLRREWYYWLKGGRDGKEEPAHVRRMEALLPCYKSGAGGAKAMPAELVQEIQRRMTMPDGGRDKHKKSPISAVYSDLCMDFQRRKTLPGIDYDLYPQGAEFPWTYSTVCRSKPPRTLRMAGNVGRNAHKAISAYVSLDYSRLRKAELYTLDDVRLDIICIDEATGKRTEVVCYILMEVGSRMIVAYVLKPASAIKQEDVDELVAYGLQTPGFGIGRGYTTHILFERGTTACSESAQMVLEGVTDGGIKVHRTTMNGGIRWVGAPKDKAKGNAAGKAVIEAFHRRLHYALLHLPGQRGNHWGNSPESLGMDGAERTHAGSLVDEAEKLARFQHAQAKGGRLQLKLPMLYTMQVNSAVQAAIQAHNTEPGHAYRGHGEFAQAETAPGVWQASPVSYATPCSSEPAEEDMRGIEPDPAQAKGLQPAAAGAGPRKYVLQSAAAEATTPKQRNAIYWQIWHQVDALGKGLNRFALTHKAIGRTTSIAQMSEPEFAKVISVFKAILRDSAAPVNQPAQKVDEPF